MRRCPSASCRGAPLSPRRRRGSTVDVGRDARARERRRLPSGRSASSAVSRWPSRPRSRPDRSRRWSPARSRPGPRLREVAFRPGAAGSGRARRVPARRGSVAAPSCPPRRRRGGGRPAVRSGSGRRRRRLGVGARRRVERGGGRRPSWLPPRAAANASAARAAAWRVGPGQRRVQAHTGRSVPSARPPASAASRRSRVRPFVRRLGTYYRSTRAV